MIRVGIPRPNPMPSAIRSLRARPLDEEAPASADGSGVEDVKSVGDKVDDLRVFTVFGVVELWEVADCLWKLVVRFVPTVVIDVWGATEGAFETVSASPTHSNAVDPIVLPDEKNRQAPISPLLTAGDMDGRRHSLRSEMTRTASPLPQEGSDKMATAAAWYVSRQDSAANEIDDPSGELQPLSENNCTEPCVSTAQLKEARNSRKRTNDCMTALGNDNCVFVQCMGSNQFFI
jgi:hypothetical protein